MTTVENKLKKIEKRWKNCSKCDLCKDRNNVVFWRGNPDSNLMIIGEAPGKNEDEIGVPFVGIAGDLFDELCNEVNGPEPWSSFICNTIGCRPPKNRKPKIDEFKACRARLYSMIYAVNPNAILLLGSTALEFLTPHNGVMSLRGNQIKVDFVWKKRKMSYPAIPTLHPAYLLRNRSVKFRRLVLNDIRTAWELSSPSFLNGG